MYTTTRACTQSPQSCCSSSRSTQPWLCCGVSSFASSETAPGKFFVNIGHCHDASLIEELTSKQSCAMQPVADEGMLWYAWPVCADATVVEHCM